MKKILISLSVVAAVAAVVIGATTAFFSDSETSTGNVLAAGEIDLGIDNHSYYNGEPNLGTTWRIDYDIDGGTDQAPGSVRQFFNFSDIKPGDWGEDTVSLHVKNNDSYLCADVTLTSDNDNSSTEPELDAGDIDVVSSSSFALVGELADHINFYWWADDGDNVFETCDGVTNVPDCRSETLLPAGPLGSLNVGQTATVALADSQINIWGDVDSVPGNGASLPGDSVRFLAKAWCFGNATMTPYPQDGGNHQSGPDDRPVVCDGTGEDNITQTDSLTADITFRAIQSRNNTGFICTTPVLTP